MKHLFIFLSLLLGGIPLHAQTRPTVVEGTIIDRPYSKTLLLFKAGEDMRIHTPLEIPILKGRFLFSFVAQPEAYELIFADEWQNGAWHSVIFFPDADTVRLTLHPRDSASRNRIIGGPDNRTQRYMDSVFTVETPVFAALDSLQESRYDNGTYYNIEAQALLDRMKNEPDESAKDSLLEIWFAMQDSRSHLSPAAAATDRQMQAYSDSVQNARCEYVRSHPSLAGYYWLYRQQLFGASGSHSLREEIYRTVYAPRFSEHPYTLRLDTLFYRQVQIGKRFPDFEAPDLEGRMHRVSELIKGKIAVIDLWASWCSPCRRSSINLLPVYNEFKDKEFTVIGVARESENADAMRQAIHKDGYPWLNLLELNDRAGIWKLYGISHAGGSQFLLDKDGTVLAVNPTASEIRRLLSEKLR